MSDRLRSCLENEVAWSSRTIAGSGIYDLIVLQFVK